VLLDPRQRVADLFKASARRGVGARRFARVVRYRGDRRRLRLARIGRAPTRLI